MITCLGHPLDIHKAAPPSPYLIVANLFFGMIASKLLLASLTFHHTSVAPVHSQSSTINYNFAQYDIFLPTDYELDVRHTNPYTDIHLSRYFSD
jgi:hypothetical protein